MVVKKAQLFYDGNKEGLPNAYELTGMPIFTGFDTLSLQFLITNFHHIILMTKVKRKMQKLQHSG